MKRRKVHPADAANAAVLANAVRYDVALFLGTGRYASRSAAADLGIMSGEVGNTRLRLRAH
jgi:hypothetical protein